MSLLKDFQKLGPAAKAAQEWGIDLALLQAQIEMTPMERIDSHQKAFELFQILREAGQNGRHKTAPSIPPQR